MSPLWQGALVHGLRPRARTTTRLRRDIAHGVLVLLLPRSPRRAGGELGASDGSELGPAVGENVSPSFVGVVELGGLVGELVVVPDPPSGRSPSRPFQGISYILPWFGFNWPFIRVLSS